MRNQDLMKDKHEKLMVAPNGLKVLSKCKKAEKLQKPNMTPNDGAKYMSYVKVTFLITRASFYMVNVFKIWVACSIEHTSCQFQHIASFLCASVVTMLYRTGLCKPVRYNVRWEFVWTVSNFLRAMAYELTSYNMLLERQSSKEKWNCLWEIAFDLVYKWLITDRRILRFMKTMFEAQVVTPFES